MPSVFSHIQNMFLHIFHGNKKAENGQVGSQNEEKKKFVVYFDI